MKELIRVRVQYASRQQCFKTHKWPLPLPLNVHINFKWFISLEELLSLVYPTPEHPVTMVTHDLQLTFYV